MQLLFSVDVRDVCPLTEDLTKNKQARGTGRSEQILPDLTFVVRAIDRGLIKYLASKSDKQNKPPDRFLNQKQQQAPRIQIRSNRGVKVNGNYGRQPN